MNAVVVKPGVAGGSLANRGGVCILCPRGVALRTLMEESSTAA